jgi:2Fe-2S ferredoxin
MPKVRFVKEGLEAEVPVGKSILDAARACGAPEGDRCGGVCACSTCHVYVLRGAELLSEVQDEEFDILDKAFDVRMESRLGCQAKLLRDGEIEVAISDESFQAFEDEHPEAAEQARASRARLR